MNKAKFITLDNGLTILIYTDNSKSTNYILSLVVIMVNMLIIMVILGVLNLVLLIYWNIIYVKIQ